MDLSILKTELNTDPKSVGYALLTDPEIAGKLNEVGLTNDTCPINIPITTLLIWLGNTGVMDALEQQRTAHADGAVRAACQVALKLLDRTEIIDVDLRNPGVEALVDRLVVGNVLTAAQKSDLYNVQAVRPCSRMEFLYGAGTVATPSIVADAKRLI